MPWQAAGEGGGNQLVGVAAVVGIAAASAVPVGGGVGRTAAWGNAAVCTGVRRSRRRGPVWGRLVRAGAGVVVMLVVAGCGADVAGPLPGHSPAPVSAEVPTARDLAGGGSAGDAEAVRLAAGRTASVATATYRLEVFVAEGEDPVLVLQVDGETDLVGQRSALVIRQWLTPGSVAAAPDGDPTEVVIDPDTVYLRSVALGEVAGTGDRWLALRDGGGSSPGASAPESVSDLLGVLTGVDAAVGDGPGEVAGVRVTWFVVDLGSGGAGSVAGEASREGNVSTSPIGGFVPSGSTAVVGVDDGGFVRLVELGVRDPLGSAGGDTDAPPGGASPPMVLRLVFTELDGTVEVRVPTDGEVVAVP